MHGKTNPSQFSRHQSPAIQAMVPERGTANVVCPTSSQITAWMVTRDMAAHAESLYGGISLVDRQQQSSWFFCGSLSRRRQGSRAPSFWSIMLIKPSCLSPALLGCAGPNSQVNVWCCTSGFCSSVTGLDRSRGPRRWSQAGYSMLQQHCGDAGPFHLSCCVPRLRPFATQNPALWPQCISLSLPSRSPRAARHWPRDMDPSISRNWLLRSMYPISHPPEIAGRRTRIRSGGGSPSVSHQYPCCGMPAQPSSPSSHWI